MFAFSLTFLAVTLLLPQATGGKAAPALGAYLHSLEPSFVAYVLSFFVITSWWSTHHRLFSCIVRYDGTLVRLNSFFLLMISVTPFLVSLLFAYSARGFEAGSESARFSVVLYAGVQALGGADLLAIWRHATDGRRLASPRLTDEWVRATERRQVAVLGVFLASIGVAFLSPLAAELVWIVAVFGLGRHLWKPKPVPAP